MYISKNLKYLRVSKKINQEEVGNILGKKKAVVSQYERGSTLPPIDVLIQMTQLFEVSLDDLIFRNIEKEGTSAAPDPAEQDAVLLSTIKRLERQVMELEGKIRERDPELARELGLG